MSKLYTPAEVAVKVLQKAEELAKAALGGLKPPKLTPIAGVISPTNANTATPGKVGSQAVVKTPKPKKLGQALDKPSVFFGKAEQNQEFKKKSIVALHKFLSDREQKK